MQSLAYQSFMRINPDPANWILLGNLKLFERLARQHNSPSPNAAKAAKPPELKSIRGFPEMGAPRRGRTGCSHNAYSITQSVVVVQENTCTVSAGKKDAVSLYYVDLQLDLAELASYSTSTISR